MATSLNVNDLQFILKKIKITDPSSAAYSAAPKAILQAIMDTYGVTAVNAAQLPAGLKPTPTSFEAGTRPPSDPP